MISMNSIYRFWSDEELEKLISPPEKDNLKIIWRGLSRAWTELIIRRFEKNTMKKIQASDVVFHSDFGGFNARSEKNIDGLSGKEEQDVLAGLQAMKTEQDLENEIKTWTEAIDYNNDDMGKLEKRNKQLEKWVHHAKFLLYVINKKKVDAENNNEPI